MVMKSFVLFAVLAGFFGTDRLTFTATSEGTPTAITRTFDSFWEAAEDAGMSRIYGGIHYDFDHEAGLASGREVGALVVRKLMHPTGRGHHAGPLGPPGHVGNGNDGRDDHEDWHGDDVLGHDDPDVTVGSPRPSRR